MGYLANEVTRFHVFVANKVEQIKSIANANQWNYIPTSEDPADLASRGVDLECLVASRWVREPEFLWQNSIQSYTYKRHEVNQTLENNNPEVKRVRVFSTATSTISIMEDRIAKFGNYSKLTRAIANLRKVAHIRSWKIKDLESEDMFDAE